MPEPSFDLSGKVAIVTGGSRGIGRAIALGLASHGADVVVASRKQADLDIVAAEIRALGRKAAAIATHMRNKEDIDRLVGQTLEQFGKIDILVNNAGTNPYFGLLMNIEESAWDQIVPPATGVSRQSGVRKLRGGPRFGAQIEINDVVAI